MMTLASLWEWEVKADAVFDCLKKQNNNKKKHCPPKPFHHNCSWWHQKTSVASIGVKLRLEMLLLKMARQLNQKCIFTDIHPLRSLNDQNDQNFAEKPAAHNLLHSFCRLIDTLDSFRHKCEKSPPSAHGSCVFLL